MARRSHGCRADLCRGSSRKVPVKSAVHGTRCRSRGLLSWLSWVLCPNSCSQHPADAALLVLWEQSAGRSLPVPPLPLSSYPSLPPSLSLLAPPSCSAACLGSCVPCISTTHRLSVVSLVALPGHRSIPLTLAPSLLFCSFSKLFVFAANSDQEVWAEAWAGGMFQRVRRPGGCS